ncbi:MAG: ACP S-malonyltransferase [Candidatus Aureabacteria bacterium]|nr:ACP S-malonyltransferase [Candidatus Auribacterota bacterium]NLW95014.1 ACP S-malonyltransferase [Chlamydiota bacterium]HOE27821.1 ACP S-malonyltransferase [bacterium]HQM53277.1 ACP S-malonyltransferase [bacterium]
MASAQRIAFIFPGQGSQEPGMGREIAGAFPEARRVFDEANGLLGFDLARLCFEGPEAELSLTKNSQPAIFTVSIACLKALLAAVPGLPVPIAAAGLSLGEFSAHVAAGSLSFADGLTLVRRRAESMQEACDLVSSAMASIVGLSPETVGEICAAQETRGVIGIANLNCPGQVVISGCVAAVEAAMEEAGRRGAQKVVRLQVSGAFHSRLMKPAEERLREAVAAATISPPRYPVIANATGLPATDPEEIRGALVRQLCAPVLWEKSVRFIIGMKAGLFIELGHGRVLSGLLRRIDRAQRAANVGDLKGLERLRAALAADTGGAT